MPITLNMGRMKVNENGTYLPVDILREAEQTTGYTSPEFFGAVGDAVHDDTVAWQSAVNSGFNVVALHKKYKCGKITVNRNIVIDCNDADFYCTGEQLFDVIGNVKATLTGQSNYSMNQVGYRILATEYADYTGFAMLQGTNNFEESRTYYYGGFVCTFRDGVMEGSYPVDVINGNDDITILIIDPVTAKICNVGSITHPLDGNPNSIKITYGLNCAIENVNSDVIDAYVFINLYRCISCTCKNIRVTGAYGTTGTNSYVVAFNDSSFCRVLASYLYNKYWHSITTGATYLCYKNSVVNCVLLNDTGTAYVDHANGRGTLLQDCVIAGALLGAQGEANNIVIVSMKDTAKTCWLTLYLPTDNRMVGAHISNIELRPDDNCTNCSIVINSPSQQIGKTFYADKIVIRDVWVNSNTVTGKIRFGFAKTQSDQNYWVIKKLLFDNCDTEINLTCTNANVDLSNMVAKKTMYESLA